MKVYLDEEVLFEIDDMMINLIAHDIADPIPDIKRRLKYIIEHKCDQCYERLQKEWVEKIRQDDSIPSIPKSKRDLCNLVFAHKDYKNRAAREAEITSQVRI